LGKHGLNGTGALNLSKIQIQAGSVIKNNQYQLNVTSSTIGGDADMTTAAATIAPQANLQTHSSVLLHATLHDENRQSSLVNLATTGAGNAGGLITMQSLHNTGMRRPLQKNPITSSHQLSTPKLTNIPPVSPSKIPNGKH
jgi:hypothetical protein